ncbi:3070_t:CDS:2, partial [Dentiscutata erythropus]
NMNTRQSFTIAFKLEVISYAEETSNCKASLFYKIHRRNNKDLNIEQVRVLEGHSMKAAYSILEKELLEFIKKRREEKGTVTTSIIIKEAKHFSETMNISGP